MKKNGLTKSDSFFITKTLQSLLEKCGFVLLIFGVALQSVAQITGTVGGDDTPELPGVSVVVKGTTTGTTTDFNGKYSINAPANSTLTFSFVGYLAQEIVVGNQSVINVSLNTDAASLEEVIVVGYGTQKKSQTTGAISQVTAKQISEMPLTNVAQALQGRVAGVDVSQSGSKPGSTPKILIRGRRSFQANNDPLYVVDGIPLAGGYEDFNPNDVQSLEILKDATATAIYGARGANGVVLITTKRGAVKGKTTVSYDTYFGQSQALDKIEIFDGAEFAEYVREAYRSTGIYTDANGVVVPTGQSTLEADKKIAVLGGDPNVAAGIAAGRNTNYQDFILKNGFIQSHSIGIQGGTDKTQFYVSGSFFKDKGISEGLDYTRSSLRANVDHNINKSVKIGLSSYMMLSDRNGENLNPYSYTLNQNPLGAPYDDEGNIIFSPTNDALLTNPLAEIVPGAQIDNTKSYRVFNSLFTEVKIMDGLKYRLNFGPDIDISRSGRFIGSETNARKGGDPQASSSNRFSFNYTLENILSYTKSFGKHNFSATALHSIQKDRFEFYGTNVQGIPAESQEYFNFGNASSVTGVSSDLIEWTINSYMGRVNYDFNDKYLLTLTIRRDGSSRFGENTKYGNFPGVAVGWNIGNEAFGKEITWLDLLKLRAGWGKVGNQAVSPYQTQGLLSRTAYAWDNTAAFGYRPSTIGNPDLRWESSATANIGLDFSMWRGRLQGSLELYQSNTTALLLADQLPGSIGFSQVTKNVGETRNRGIELGFTTVNVNSNSGFKWTTDVQFTKNKEAIIELYNGKIDDIGNRWFIGQPLNSFYDYKKAGIWQLGQEEEAKSYGSAVGQIRVQDTNNDGVINADDRVIIGSDVPDFSAGLTNRFSYKNIDLSFFLFGRFGNTIVSGFHQSQNALAGRYQQIKVDYWTPLNPTNEFPQPKSTQEFPVYNTTLIYFDGSFVKLRNINVGYSLNESLANKLGMESLRLFSSIQQPAIWSEFRNKYNGVDPEATISSATTNPITAINNGVTPATKVFTFGLNAKF
ncbi:SusC/RagA family TonB-linked outer membrane protein [Arcticibacterium luteifluviistationis]|uniref:SusC/RagA family TonB-linked outer membrane protein n=1 Tax=Arcticibacterium luteifluviistationis TaxID=1784714 RepID=A0A2Z4GDQ3_9BACT|nr:TonB-dependent receptor [Arcticibacterium luteifluviistationis]AWV99260.1 SusC/RagA family TonB-linked outer membrane protein [Arcticibacterium luteifluviistationis]